MGNTVRYWFEQAVEVSAASRVEFLKARCRDDAVRAEVLSLLEHDIADASPPPMIRTLVRSVIEPAAPVQRVGAFELGKLLGSGGMGFVYEAYRVDGQVRQRAAVKFAQVSPAASEKFRASLYRRFARERQVMASLRHPYIAGLIDAGSTSDGTPYAVIEQVDGVPIDSYCDASLPDKADRIRLVLKLCDAVQFAHRNLIVHGDIKPDNILITADGIPKLIDFGVANDLSDHSPASTMRGFTPGYASPEQRRGSQSSIASDVYGLGAVLYRLLTGAPPRDASDEEVLRPSAIRSELRGDLENILLKALRPDPRRRYGSVPDLADDLNRFLQRRPVRASPDSAWYRGSRFVCRHRVSLAATVVFLAALVSVTATSLKQRQDTLRRGAETRSLADRLLFQVHDQIRDVAGATRAREGIAHMSVQYLERLEREHGRDPELAWELVNAYARLGQSRGGVASSLGDTKSGLHFAAKALALGPIVEAATPTPDRLDSLFGIYEGSVPIFLESRHLDEARQAIDRMLGISPLLHPIREAQALKQLARYTERNGSTQGASEVWARALAVLRAVSRSTSRPADTDAQLVSTLVGFGRAQGLAGDFLGAVASLREAIALSEAMRASGPNVFRNTRQLYWSHITLGDVLGAPVRFSLGRFADAAEQYRIAQRLAEELVRADPANDMAKLDLSRAFSREGMALAEIQPERALASLERSYRLAMETSATNESSLDARSIYLTASVGLLARLGRFEQARANLSDARRLAVDRKALLKAEALHLYATGQPREALTQAQKHLAMLPAETRPVLSENHATVEVLERIRVYAARLDPGACVSASARLVRIWSDLRAAYPHSDFVRRQSQRAQIATQRGC